MYRENIINIVLGVILSSISCVFFMVLKKDRFFEKCKYGTIIGINANLPTAKYYSDGRANPKKNFAVQVFRSGFYNDFKKDSEHNLNKEGEPDYDKFLQSSSMQDINYYPYRDRDPELLPNHLFVEWYSYSEDKFYLLKQKLDYDKILKACRILQRNGDNWTKNSVLATIRPNGNINISMLRQPQSVSEVEKYELINIQDLHAKTVEKDWKILKREKFELSNINSRNELSSLMNDKFKWSFNILLPENYRVNYFDMILFSGDFEDRIGTELPTHASWKLSPKIINLKYSGGGTEGTVQWRLDGKEIFDAFKKLKNLVGKEDIELSLDLKTDIYDPILILRKGNTSIVLKNINQ